MDATHLPLQCYMTTAATSLAWFMPLLQAAGFGSDYSAESCKEWLDQSVQRLGVDYIDSECCLELFAMLAAFRR